MVIGAFLGVILALSTVTPVKADYDVGTGWHALWFPSGVFYDEGTVLQGEGPYTWQGWMGVNKFTYTWVGCGSSQPCILFLNDDDNINNTSCYMPPVDPYYFFAYTAILAGPTYTSFPNDPNCNWLGSLSYPIFVIAINDEWAGWDQVRIWHVGRHETGHVLNLPHPASSVGCWWGTNDPFLGSYWYPLMKGTSQDGNCGIYPNNYAATTNEMNAVRSRNGW